ncbi:MAG TPA: formate dehydrogenase subunit gamma [Steroidobacteraceae bacterium]|nr:formate dehydrogenase subunit gamma [Steroidobacteraceae bacterium]
MSVPGDNERLQRCVSGALARLAHEPGPLLEILHAVQDELGCVPEAAVPLIADALNLSRAEVHGVISFYHHFRSRPVGRLHVQICRAEACRSMNGEAVAQQARARFGVEFGETRADGAVTLDEVYCLGLCACAPSALCNGEPVGNVDAQALERIARQHQVT